MKKHLELYLLLFGLIFISSANAADLPVSKNNDCTVARVNFEGYISTLLKCKNKKHVVLSKTPNSKK